MTTISSQISSITYDDGNKRNVYRVLDNGLVQTGTQAWDGQQWLMERKQVWDDAAEEWLTPADADEDWRDWTKDQIVRASRSPNGTQDQQWLCRLPEDVRQVIRAHYGLVAAQHKCPHCGKPVVVQGSLCGRCQDEQ